MDSMISPPPHSANIVNRTRYAMQAPDEKNMKPCGNLCFNVRKNWFKMN